MAINRIHIELSLSQAVAAADTVCRNQPGLLQVAALSVGGQKVGVQSTQGGHLLRPSLIH